MFEKNKVKDVSFLKTEINRLRKEKNAVILGHFYQENEIQEIADFIGDSLDLSRKAKSTKADLIIFAGVHFMAETAKILSPHKKVIIPDLEAGCSLADSCKPEDFKKFIDDNPGHTVISYVNTTAEIKSLTDIVCTSTNAVGIVNSLPKDEKIIFGPDRNLGRYINSVTGRNMLVWDGACHVHEKFSVERIVNLKKQYPNAKILAHPECKQTILILADFIGSTSAMLNYSVTDDCNEFIVATESGILFEMKKKSPNKTFIPAPPDDSTCACNDCEYMKRITLEKIYNSLVTEDFEIIIEENLRLKAEKSINNMLEISDKLGL